MNHSPESYLEMIDTHRSQSWGTGAQNGAAIDCLLYRRAAFHVRVGVIGASGTVDYKIQESADGSTGWADVTGAAITQLTASDGKARIAINCEKTKRYLRAVLTIGTAASQVAAFAVLLEPKDTLQPSATSWVTAP